VINHDPDIGGRLRVAFPPNFNVTMGELIYPAADLSEQISMAGKEASGTGNMKFALNGALTVGTLDGANIEIRQRVGADNFFLFGLTVEDIVTLRADGYQPLDYYHGDPTLKRVIDSLTDGCFSGGDKDLFRPIVDSLLHHDPYLLLADYAAYVQVQERVDAAYRDEAGWTRMSILNTARCGFFSSDRAMREYCRDIWRATPVLVE
jgi:starch phosphorylase